VAVFYSLQVARAADYIRDNIEPKLQAQAPGSVGWHTMTGDRTAMIRRTQLVHYWPFLLVVLIPSFLAIALGWRYSSAAGISIAFTVIDIVLLGLFFWIYHSNRRVL
jgi:hypothetical protein